VYPEIGQILDKAYPCDEIVDTVAVVAEFALKIRFSLTEVDRHGIARLLRRYINSPHHQHQEADNEGFKDVFHIT
jgi:hypothetical protein